MIEKFLDFLNAAGKIAMDGYYQDRSDDFKSEFQVDIVTATDLKISAEFQRFCASNFSDLDYIIVDEESAKNLGNDPIKEIEKHEWQFVIDPIDGTLMYANAVPMFGISIGILHNGVPHSGLIFAPALDELVYFDGTDAFWVKNNNKTKLEHYQYNKKQFIVFAGTSLQFDKVPLSKLNFGSCVISEMYLATGRASVYYFSQSLWDMAGSWALLQHLGIKFINYRTGEVLEKLSAEYFGDNFRIKDLYVVCKQDDYDQYKTYVKYYETRA